MKFYLMRHGEAESRAASDFDRKLTANGAAIVEQVAEKLCAKILSVPSAGSRAIHLWASPYVRAQETVRIVQTVLSKHGVDSPVNTTAVFVPEGRVVEAYDFLNNLHVEEVLVVSHQPLVSGLLDDFSGEAAGFYDMGTASIAEIECSYAGTRLGNVNWIRHSYEW